MADFTGFYFDDIHSSTYHVLRVSDGDRYKEGLFPEFEDRAVELVGGDGSIYEGTNYKQTEFTINIAFDSITEQDFKDIKKWLQPNKIKSFRFDERPYKAYWAKLRTRPVFEYVCFLEENGDGFLGTKERVYKGEATLEFIAYDPFGYCFDNSTQISQKGLREADGINWQALDSYSSFVILDDNVDEWGLTSGLKNKSQLQDYNNFTPIQQKDNIDYIAKLYNPGDFDVDFELFFGIEFPPLETGLSETLLAVHVTLEITDETENSQFFVFSLENLKNTDSIFLNSKKHSLTVFHDGAAEELRYDLVKSTHWPKIPIGESTIKITSRAPLENLQIKYGYKYY